MIAAMVHRLPQANERGRKSPLIGCLAKGAEAFLEQGYGLLRVGAVVRDVGQMM